ncbi:hypothetical protein COCSUDRAFT_32282 [Coccomyxa subellipsoidea C-169]|uniref:Uncharacterized protein n=1 Tax=Coccomyxa subellipsoidea (strain C-169) TaxID=574566 RepID=I0Z851_COCSC|nr:hypothetical protein COCSUDRAFT_32282 [Coccomyxa subellipsoidea C-169]EIE26820.1 hypothetical protein COCSUDRAFT_32282 [Coccomyxa subellipsoidea C-169]|eukprot:XP_005651364.1 hypothetical protein COCSUDRAFT_32282 [Coccomyxa subellipsoidea C-169]
MPVAFYLAASKPDHVDAHARPFITPPDVAVDMLTIIRHLIFVVRKTRLKGGLLMLPRDVLLQGCLAHGADKCCAADAAKVALGCRILLQLTCSALLSLRHLLRVSSS